MARRKYIPPRMRYGKPLMARELPEAPPIPKKTPVLPPLPPEPDPGHLETPIKPPQELGNRERQHLRSLVIEKARRSIESLRLYEPLPLLEKFHASTAKMRIIRGSNRAGKTL